ncbi:MAG: gamma-glutamyl-gamma-aminobutyrate hydrolase family protein [Planctomycetota bacterium]
MTAPLIGITLDNFENSAASGKYEVGVGYSRAVAEAGGVPVLLPHEVTLVPEYVQRCDGLILTGGVDPDTAALPADWPGHAPVHPQARVMDPTRQAFELALLAEWDRVKPNSPLLGVCLGMQLLTLHQGGTLNQYLPDTHSAEVIERHRKNDHTIRVTVDDSVLPQPAMEAEAITHSNHQQAIDDPGDLRVVAVAEDGIIEAVDDPDRSFRLGVQWHPERGDTGPLSQSLLHRLVRSAGANSR